MEEAQFFLGVAQDTEQTPRIFETQLDAELLRGIEPRQRLLKVHFFAGAR
jgi:hypothetical protein